MQGKRYLENQPKAYNFDCYYLTVVPTSNIKNSNTFYIMFSVTVFSLFPCSYIKTERNIFKYLSDTNFKTKNNKLTKKKKKDCFLREQEKKNAWLSHVRRLVDEIKFHRKIITK